MFLTTMLIVHPLSVCVCVSVSVCVCATPLTVMCWADAPCMAGSGRVPGIEAARGCLCLFLRCSKEDSDPGTGLRSGEERKATVKDLL